MSPRSRTPWGQRSERARRIAAARILHGWEPGDLDERLEAADVGKKGTTTRLENDKAKPRDPAWDKIIQVLEVPPEWFSAPLEDLLRGAAETPESELDDLAQRIVRAVERLVQQQPRANPTSGRESAPTQKPKADDPPLAGEQP